MTRSNGEMILDEDEELSNNSLERQRKRKAYLDMIDGMTPKEVGSVLLEIPRQLSICSGEIAKYNKELDKHNIQANRIYGRLYKDFKFGITNKKYRFANKGEIESQIYSHDDWLVNQRKIDSVKYRIDYWTRVGTETKETSFALKNWIEYQKHLAGDF